jgi:hypothetical protein
MKNPILPRSHQQKYKTDLTIVTESDTTETDGINNPPRTSALLIFVSHRSSAFLRVILLIAFETQLTAVLHAGSQVSCHNCRKSYLPACFSTDAACSPGDLLVSCMGFAHHSVHMLQDATCMPELRHRKTLAGRLHMRFVTLKLFALGRLCLSCSYIRMPQTAIFRNS